MTDHLIQHTCAERGITTFATDDGQNIVVQWKDTRKELSFQNAVLWTAAFMSLAMMPPDRAAVMLETLPPHMEDARAFLAAAVASPGLTALYGLLLRYAVEDAKCLREPPTDSELRSLGFTDRAAFAGSAALGGLLP